MLMSLFGGLSRAERRRLQIRTRNAMFAHGAAGRWLGGRPNYGYRVVDTDLPHPQRQKAAAGIRLRVLSPTRTPRRSCSASSRCSTTASATAPSRPSSNARASRARARSARPPPRSAGVWSGSAVRAILVNPRYLGHQVVGRQRRRDELLDPTNPAVGTASKQRWQAPDHVGDLRRARVARAGRARSVGAGECPGPQQPRPAPPTAARQPGIYVLAGLIRCSVCGRSMHGATMKGKAYYRCNRQRPDYADTGHPRSTAIREERILTALDTWLNQLTDAEHRASTLAAVLAAEADTRTRDPRGPSREAGGPRAARRARPRARRRPRRHGPRPSRPPPPSRSNASSPPPTAPSPPGMPPPATPAATAAPTSSPPPSTRPAASPPPLRRRTRNEGPAVPGPRSRSAPRSRRRSSDPGSSVAAMWWRGQDLNLRPSGYEAVARTRHLPW